MQNTPKTHHVSYYPKKQGSPKSKSPTSSQILGRLNLIPYLWSVLRFLDFC